MIPSTEFFFFFEPHDSQTSDLPTKPKPNKVLTVTVALSMMASTEAVKEYDVLVYKKDNEKSNLNKLLKNSD